MASDKILRKSAFGGFKREDVIDYIEKLQAQALADKRSAEESARFAEGLAARANECDRLEKMYEQATEENRELNARLEALKEKNDEYERQLYNYGENFALLEAKLSELEERCAQINDSEKQINGLVLDAVLYSDKIIGKARDAARAVSDDARQTITATADEIDSIGSEIGRISGDFSEVIARLSEKLGVLSKDINELTARFDTPEDEEDGQFRLNENGLMLLDELYMKAKSGAEEGSTGSP